MWSKEGVVSMLRSFEFEKHAIGAKTMSAVVDALFDTEQYILAMCVCVKMDFVYI